MTITKPAAVCLALAILSTPAMAVEHAETGLKVELDDAFVIDETPLDRPNYDVVYGVNAASGEPPIVGTGEHLCEIGFQTAPQNADLTQDEINAMIAEPGWPKMAQRAMASIFDFNGAVPFELDGITGYEFIGTPKMGPDAADVRIAMSMLETPLGRTVVTCAATAGTIEQANTVFRTIRDGVTPPR